MTRSATASTSTLDAAPEVSCSATGLSLGGELGEAFAACAQVVRSRARNFYYGLRLTPEPRRSAIYSVYAWMRAADDAADAPASIGDRRAALARFAANTERLLRREAVESPEPFWHALGATIAHFPVPARVFRDMLAGLEDDLAARPVTTEADLERYCYRVASTAGLACLSIWGLRPGADRERAEALAIRRGQAFQRTNILRDFAQDFDDTPRRVYLPAEAFARHGLTPESLRAWSEPSRCAALVLEQAAIARAHYDGSAELESLVSADCAPTLWAMTRIYSGLLGVIEADPARIVSAARVRLSSASKAAIALRAAWGSRRGWWRS